MKKKNLVEKNQNLEEKDMMEKDDMKQKAKRRAEMFDTFLTIAGVIVFGLSTALELLLLLLFGGCIGNIDHDEYNYYYIRR